jgi:hypothetical protein
MAPPAVRLFDKCVPLIAAGETLDVSVSQWLRDGGKDLLLPNGDSTVKFIIEGPQVTLTPDDVAGVYPAPGSEDSPDEFLPHVALRRHTLPWERVGPTPTNAAAPANPWVALLVLRASELAYTVQKAGKPGAFVHRATVASVAAIDPAGHVAITGVAKVPASTMVDLVYLTNLQVSRLLPTRDELGHLCHVKRLTEPDPSTGTDAHTDRAIVIANRLPDATPSNPQNPDSAAETHVALLVSLERRNDLYAAPRLAAPGARAALIVLRHWTFTPSKGGDFEQVVRAIRYRPNGGVLRFGSVPADVRVGETTLSGGFAALVQPNGAPLEPFTHEHEGEVMLRGPLRPFAPPARTDGFAVQAAPEEWEGDDVTDDYTYATAFELGRLLVLADAGLLQDLRDMRPVFPPIETPLEQNTMPPVLQKPDWVSNPAWIEQPWEMAEKPMLEETGGVLDGIEFDPGGIAGHIDPGVFKGTLEPLGMPMGPVVASVEIGNLSVEKLNKQFVAVVTAAQS